MKKLLIILLVLLICVPLFAQRNSTGDVINNQWNHTALNIALGNATGKTMVHQYGHNHALAATNETVYEQSDAKKYINHGTLIDVVAQSAADDTSGTGIRTIQITGLDSSWAAQTETVILAGAATVQTANKYIRIFKVEAVTAGSNGVAADSILIQNTTNDTTLIMMEVGETSAYAAIYSVPAGKTCYITYFFGSTAKGILTVLSLWERKSGTTVWIEKDGGQVWLDNFQHYHNFPITFSAKSDIQVRAKGDVSDVSAGFMGWVE